MYNTSTFNNITTFDNTLAKFEIYKCAKMKRILRTYEQYIIELRLNILLSQIITALKTLIPAQHTLYWYNIRRYRVGASEIAVFIGHYDKSYANIKSKLIEKVHAPVGKYVNRFIGDAAAWGTILEDVVRTFCEYEFHTVIHETGSIPNLPGQSMSPDGLSVVGQDVVLWEFKCPSSRSIGENTVPKHYMAQLLTGLETFRFCDYAIFVETVIKRCSLYEDGSNYKYDYAYPPPRRGMKTVFIKYPKTWGAISFICKYKKDEITSLDSQLPGMEALKVLLSICSAEQFIDFGSCDKKILIFMMEAFVNKHIELKYIYQQHPDHDAKTQVDDYSASQLIAEAHEELDGRQLLGIMRWKMVDCNIKRVERQPGFLEATNKYAQLVNECVASCDKMDNFHSKELCIKETEKNIRRLLTNDKTISIIADYVDDH